MSNKVIVNQIFTGSYNSTGIGHEFINLLNPDGIKDKRYLYICPKGYVKKTYTDPKYIVFIRTINRKKVQILGISAEHKYALNNLNIPPQEDEFKSVYNAQSSENLKYLNTLLQDYFKGQSNTVLYSFISTKFYKPTKNIYFIINEDNKELDESSNEIYIDLTNILKLDNRKVLANTSMLSYYDSKDFCKIIEKLINSGDFVLDNNDSFDVLYNKSTGTYKEFFKKSFLDTINKTNDELAFSNWLASLLKSNNEFFKSFIENILSKKSHTLSQTNTLIDIVREQSAVTTTNQTKKIDLWIETDEYIIYIENKIKSDINGYNKHSVTTETYTSQLSNYYEYAEKYNKENYNGKKTIIPVLLVPNYSEIVTIKNYLSNFTSGTKYLIFTYKELKEFCDDFHNKNQSFNEEYFDEFRNAIDRHTKNLPLGVYEEIYQKVIDFNK